MSKEETPTEGFAMDCFFLWTDASSLMKTSQKVIDAIKNARNKDRRGVIKQAKFLPDKVQNARFRLECVEDSWERLTEGVTAPLRQPTENQIDLVDRIRSLWWLLTCSKVQILPFAKEVVWRVIDYNNLDLHHAEALFSVVKTHCERAKELYEVAKKLSEEKE